jgi:RNA polymerase sigma-70 factor (ECF subfamily)
LAQSLENIDDESLMERIQSYDHQAFSILVERRAEMFYAAAYRIVMNKQEAEDIVQDAFLKIWEKPKIWKKGKGAKFTTWFYRLVTNIALDNLRRKKPEADINDLENTIKTKEVGDSSLIINQEQKALNEAIKNLPEKQMLALNLCFYEGLSNKDAAAIIGVSTKALESLLMRAKSGVKDQLIRDNILENKKGEVA